MTAPPSFAAPPKRSAQSDALGLPPPSERRILRIKIGYNPNSSSIGTIVFGVPAPLAVLTAAFATAASILTAALLRARPGRDAAPATTATEPGPSTGEPADGAVAAKGDGDQSAEDRAP